METIIALPSFIASCLPNPVIFIPAVPHSAHPSPGFSYHYISYDYCTLRKHQVPR